MALIPFPPVTVAAFRFGIDDGGRVEYRSSAEPRSYRVGPDWSRLVGTIVLAPMSDLEGRALDGFLLDLDGDANHQVLVPWDRQPARLASSDDGRTPTGAGEGVFAPDTALTITGFADGAGDDDTTLSISWAPAGDAEVGVGSILLLNGVLCKLRAVAAYDADAGTASATAAPIGIAAGTRIEAGSPNSLAEGVVKAEFTAASRPRCAGKAERVVRGSRSHGRR